MKKILVTLALLVATTMLFAQAPQKFSYQGVIRDAAGNLVRNAPVGVRVSLLKNSTEGVAVYCETHRQTTNANGLLTLTIGDGTVVGGDMAAIDWADGPYFLKTETDITGGSNYTLVGAQQLLSVPYALYAGSTTNGFSGDYNDLSNKPEIPAAQVNADWKATEGVAEILNKPTKVSDFENDAKYLTEANLAARLDALQQQIDSLKEQIGEGSFGKIFKVSKDGKNYAMKKLIGTNELDFESLQHEYDILRNVSSSKNLNVITIYGMQSKKLDKTTTVLYILMELAISDWETAIKKKSINKDYYTEKELTSIIKILIKSFSELQKENISHRDIKPQNILICENNIFKIGDFGEAKELRRKKKVTGIQTIRGTEIYMSPLLYSAIQIEKDAIETKHNTYKSDVYSLGLCLFYAATLNFNLLSQIRDVLDMKILEKIIRKNVHQNYSENMILLIMGMLEVEQEKRMDFIELEKFVLELGLEE